MNALANLDIICARVVDCYKKIFGADVKEIFLYGSYARGDFDEESDIDFAAIINGDRLQLQKNRRKLLHETVKIDLEYDVVISPKIIPHADFSTYAAELPYYRNIFKECKKIA